MASQLPSLCSTLSRMAREVVIRMTDDLDRTQEATETREIGYNGVVHRLDLTEANAKKLDKALAPYLAAAHNREKQRSKTAKTSTSAEKAARQAIRAWAKDNGYDLKSRGVIPKQVIEAYQATQP